MAKNNPGEILGFFGSGPVKMNGMKLKIILLILVSVFLFRGEARADLYFQQDVHMTQKGVSEDQPEPTKQDFRRKIYVLGQVFVIQIEEGGVLKKEYGFDFVKDLYYEADPANDYFKLFDLKILGEVFQKMGRTAPESMGGAGRGIAKDLTRSLLEGKSDYPVHIRQAFFAKKEFEGRRARLYKLRVGPGTAFLNFFGWYRKADIWAATDVPGFSDYEAVRVNLKKKAAFYKIKHNQVSDLIVTLSALKAVPLRIDSVSKRIYERATSEETSREITSLISTAPIKRGQLLYYKEASRFLWNPIFAKGTEFGPDVSVASGEAFDMRRSLPWLLFPALFFVLTYLWFLGGYKEEKALSLRRFVVLRIYILVSVLFALEITHYARELPFLISPLFEFSFVAALGVVWAGWQVYTHVRTVEKQMREAHLKFCPHCGVQCEAFYLVCPNCNRPL